VPGDLTRAAADVTRADLFVADMNERGSSQARYARNEGCRQVGTLGYQAQRFTARLPPEAETLGFREVVGGDLDGCGKSVRCQGSSLVRSVDLPAGRG